MARLKSKRSALKVLSCKFGGMGKHTPLSPESAADMCNFRILPGGILKTRTGYKLKKHFLAGQKVRGVWKGSVQGISLLFAVAGDKIYRLEGDAMAQTVVGSVANGENPVHFCIYLDTLYLLDGTNIYQYSTVQNKFQAVEAYVPLYGYQWNPTTFGEVNEKINLLSPRLRIHYYNEAAESIFLLPYYAQSVDMVRSDGVKTSSYTFTPGSNRLVVHTASIHLEVGITVSLNEEMRAQMLASQLSYIYSQNGENKLFLGDNQGHLFCSNEVSEPMLSSCRVIYPDATPLYFCSDDILFLGDSANPVTAMCPFYDTILAFTRDRIWNLAFEKGILEVALATNKIGCASPFGAIPYQNGVIAVMENDVYLINASVARTEQLSFERISAGITGKLAPDFASRAHLFWNLADGEIWMRDPENDSGEVWVWNTLSGEWYRFDNIPASFFFKIDVGFGFAQSNDIFLFDRFCFTDCDMPISAFYKSTYLDLGTSDIPRRSVRAYLYSARHGGNSTLLLETERSGRLFDIKHPRLYPETHLQEMRMPSHRCRFLRFTLSASASTPAEFYRLDICSLP